MPKGVERLPAHAVAPPCRRQVRRSPAGHNVGKCGNRGGRGNCCRCRRGQCRARGLSKHLADRPMAPPTVACPRSAPRKRWRCCGLHHDGRVIQAGRGGWSAPMRAQESAPCWLPMRLWSGLPTAEQRARGVIEREPIVGGVPAAVPPEMNVRLVTLSPYCSGRPAASPAWSVRKVATGCETRHRFGERRVSGRALT